MQSNIELMQKKLARLEKALILATEEDAKFKLEDQIYELRQKIANFPK